MEPTFFTTVHSFQGGSKHEKTHIIVYKGSLLPQRFKLSFFTNIIPKYRLCFRNTTFFTKVLLCFLFRTIASLQISNFLYIKVPMNSQGLCYQPLSQTYLDKQNTHTLYIDMYTVCICIFQYSKWRKTVLPFSVCTFLSPPITHFFMQNTCCHLYMGTTLFHKGPPPQRSSIALKTNIFTKVAPQVSAVLQEPHLFFVRKGKNKENNKTNQNMKDKEQKGKERKHI